MSTFCSYAAAGAILSANRDAQCTFCVSAVRRLFLQKLIAATIDNNHPQMVCLIARSLDDVCVMDEVCKVENHEALKEAATECPPFREALANFCACFEDDDEDEDTGHVKVLNAWLRTFGPV
jgi:hypothetical protein